MSPERSTLNCVTLAQMAERVRISKTLKAFMGSNLASGSYEIMALSVNVKCVLTMYV